LPIKTDGVPPTIFCVHGTDGESMLPPQLAAALGNRPVYAYRAIGLEENEHALTSIEAIARDYIEAIDAVAPKGPILILGHCDGSLIAYEMARQLTAQGRPPRGLVMVDPSADSHRAPQLHDSGLALLLKRSRLRNISDTLRGQFGAAAGKVSGAERREMVRLALNVAASQYEVKRYEGPVLFFYTPERKLRLLDPRTGFPAHIPNLYVVELFVEHQEMFKRELPRIAAEVNAFIARLGM
jgi:thioesterase domain-containing protein